MQKTIQYREAFAFGWRSFKGHWHFLVATFLLLFALSALSDYLTDEYFKDIEPTASILSILFSFALLILYFNLVRSLLRMVDGNSPNIQHLFEYDRSFWHYFIGLCLYSVVTFAGFLLLVVPGIYFALRYSLYLYLIADRNLGPIDAFRESARLTHGVKWQLIGLSLLSYLAVLGGALFFGVGLIVALPVVSLAAAYVYRSLSQQANEPVPVTAASALAKVPTSQGMSLEKTSDYDVPHV